MSDDVVVNEVVESFWQDVEETASSAQLSGTIAEVEIGFGYKVFGTGMKGAEGFFPVIVGDKPSVQSAKRLANQFVIDNSLQKNPSYVFRLTMFKDAVLNKETSGWKDDERWYFAFPGSEPYTLIIAPKLKAAGVAHTGKMWAKIQWGQDFSRMRQKRENGVDLFDENGEAVMEPSLFPYISKVYSSREEAATDAGMATVGEPKAESYPEGYSESDWKAVAAEIKAAHANGTPIPQLVSDYMLTDTWITKAINS